VHWSGGSRPVDLFDVKGIVELVCGALGVSTLEFTPSEAAFLVTGRTATVRSGGNTVGILGQLVPTIAEAHGFALGEEIYAVELDMDALSSVVPVTELRTESLPKYPGIVRDLSILVGEALPAAAVRGTIRSVAPRTLQSVVEFDRYQGKGIADGRVSLSLRLTFRSAERTLTDDEVEAAMNTIVGALEQAHAVRRR
jgi:phenylalanyl-tRNA synthetase beta chain